MKYRIWYSTESFADYIISKTSLRERDVTKSRMYESDANNPKNFHTIPDHIKQILYLDAPDIIVELDMKPVFSIEVTTEAGTGHNAFQRFARIAASVENNVPSVYIYPEAAIISRRKGSVKWDSINPLVFKALDDVMSIYNIPALLYYFPSDFRENKEDPAGSPNFDTKGLQFEASHDFAGSPKADNPEMQDMFTFLNEAIDAVEKHGVIPGREKLISKRVVIDRRRKMHEAYAEKGGNLNMSPLSATVEIPTEYLLNYLSSYENADYKIGELLRSREKTIIYKLNARFRGDPYPGALAAIDYLSCREGKTFEERKNNLVLAWGEFALDDENETISLQGNKADINDFVDTVKRSEDRNLLKKGYETIPAHEIPRYYMQVRHGSSFSKAKHIRVYSYFADAILFPNGSLWRDA